MHVGRCMHARMIAFAAHSVSLAVTVVHGPFGVKNNELRRSSGLANGSGLHRLIDNHSICRCEVRTRSTTDSYRFRMCNSAPRLPDCSRATIESPRKVSRVGSFVAQTRINHDAPAAVRLPTAHLVVQAGSFPLRQALQTLRFVSLDSMIEVEWTLTRIRRCRCGRCRRLRRRVGFGRCV